MRINISLPDASTEMSVSGVLRLIQIEYSQLRTSIKMKQLLLRLSQPENKLRRRKHHQRLKRRQNLKKVLRRVKKKSMKMEILLPSGANLPPVDLVARWRRKKTSHGHGTQN